MVLAKAVKKNNFNCCYNNFPFSAFMMMNAHLYFSICSYKNVEGNELAQQKLKPKLISRCSKCSIASLSVGTSAANSEKNHPNKPSSVKPRNRWQRKRQSPFVVFPSILQASRACLASTERLSKPLGASPHCSGCQAWGPAAGGAGVWLHHHQGGRFLPKLFMSFPRLAAVQPTESFRPFTLHFPTCITDLGITFPALLAVSLELLHHLASLFR